MNTIIENNKTTTQQNFYRGLGRRKTASARVILKNGSGKFVINEREAKKYLISSILLQEAIFPLAVTDNVNKYDVFVNVQGGGLAGQADAIKLGIARALLNISPDYRVNLKKHKLLTCDSRIKERKKPGLRKARKARQFSKR
ncbi:MAG: 30S ribosomal protein S9 [Mycoplasma sp.]|nr:30S ribosomal protein S9 [Mycoplasma sp.]